MRRWRIAAAAIALSAIAFIVASETGDATLCVPAVALDAAAIISLSKR